MSRANNSIYKLDLYDEASRQLLLCNACRYCEGYCAVFPAIERRISYDKGYIEYIANLCHDCRSCYPACPYIPPHEFSINIPMLLSSIRLEIYAKYTYPEKLSRIFFKRPLASSLVVTLISIAVMWLLAIIVGDPSRIFQKHLYSGSFYTIFPHWTIVAGGLTLLIYITTIMVVSSVRYWRAINRNSSRSITIGVIIGALWDAISHKYFRGGGAGCEYPGEFGGYRRLYMHLFLFLGFLLATMATIVAAIYQEALGIMPPYDYLSLPVILGTSGGILITIGCFTLIYYKARSARTLIERKMAELDRFMLLLIGLISLTGVVLLISRDTEYMGSLFITHMGLVLALFLLAPYSKLIHIPYRILSLAKYRLETG
ncbi:MAG: tricarballylate utilization 4Fe-4S protein TcuB [Sulfolobales archaeon]